MCIELMLVTDVIFIVSLLEVIPFIFLKQETDSFLFF